MEAAPEAWEAAASSEEAARGLGVVPFVVPPARSLAWVRSLSFVPRTVVCCPVVLFVFSGLPPVSFNSRYGIPAEIER